jgi:hypothetical protein
MGDGLRRRAALWLGIGRVWVELDALALRLKRIETDVYGPTPKTGVRDRASLSDSVVPLSRTHQKGGEQR